MVLLEPDPWQCASRRRAALARRGPLGLLLLLACASEDPVTEDCEFLCRYHRTCEDPDKDVDLCISSCLEGVETERERERLAECADCSDAEPCETVATNCHLECFEVPARGG